MASGGTFIINYPSTVTAASTLTTCKVTYSGVTYSMTGCTVDTSAKTIKVKTGFNTAVSAGGSVSI